MPRTTVYQGQVDHVQLLDEDGRLDTELAGDLLSDEAVVALYKEMIFCREFDEQAFKLQRSGRMGTFPQNKGEEAVSLGAAHAIRKGVDHIVPYYRENAALHLHGLPLHYILLHWMGDERGNAIPSNYLVQPICVAIGAQVLHAVGIAWAYKLRKEDRAVLTFFGEGATSTGEFHEAMNFASVMKAPCIFCCVNNRWAISVPSSKQSASKTFAQKALAYGIPTMQVDGNDLFAVYAAHRQAVERARSGGGPTMIEALTYRLGDHTTADDARRYRAGEELEAALRRDPLLRTRKYLESKELWDDAAEAREEERARAITHEIVEAAMATPAPPESDLFDYTFAELPEQIQRQRDTQRTDSIGQDPSQIGLQPPAEPSPLGRRPVPSG